MFNKPVKYLFVLLISIGFLAVRYFEKDLFYDPFLDFFKHSDYKSLQNPAFDESKIWFFLLFRYFLNALLGLLLILLLFGRKIYYKFYLGVVFLALALLIPLYAFFLYNGFDSSYMIGFYVRRFLIQPMFVIILLPAFLFFDRVNSRKN